MDRENTHTLLELLGSSKTVDRGEWVSGECPFASWTHSEGQDSHPSFGVSVGQSSGFHCFTCGVRGPVTKLPTMMAHYTEEDPLELRKHISVTENVFGAVASKATINLVEIPKETYDKYDEVPDAILKKFNLDLVSKYLWRLKFDSEEQRLLFPVYDKLGRFVGVRGRFVGNSEMLGVLRYRSYSELVRGTDCKRAGVWFGEHFPIVPGKRLVLVEGERDAIALRQIGVQNVYASMGASVATAQIDKLLRLPERTVIQLYLDNDEAGERSKERIQKRLYGSFRVVSVKDYRGTKDPAEAVERGVATSALRS